MQKTGTPSPVSLAAVIGDRVRTHRTSRGWTLEQLAERSRVSRRMLVSIEQGQANPSVATLLQIGDSLGVGLPALVDAGEPAPLRLSRHGEAPVLWRGPAGGQALLVAGTERPQVVELWDWTLAVGETHGSEAHASGTRELLLVAAGELRLRVGGRTELLGVGDSASFHGDLPHGYANAGDGATHFVLTVFQPGVGGAA